MPLSEAELRARLADPARLSLAAPSASDDAERARAAAPGGRLIHAAVLVPILARERPSVLLTLRSGGLAAHAGQVAFPGGRIEPGESPEQAALREAAEEVGLDPRTPALIARLPAHLTGTGYSVTPVVATLDGPDAWLADPAEVAEVFEYPLATILDAQAPRRERAVLLGREREYWVWPHERHFIWGATAAILVNLARVLRG
jgi:8-oxo-dGTP pyrophosphatase MutT (NUDIX family)